MAKVMTDIKCTGFGDIDLSTGDIIWADGTLEHQRDIMLARKGDYRTSPTVGVGAEDYLDDERPDDLYREIRTQLAQDGMTVIKVGPQTIAYYE